MTDKWLEAADRIRVKKEADALAMGVGRDASEQGENAARQLLDLAVIDAAQSLADFMEQRGEAATALLTARGNRSHVLFGVEHDGGCYTSVYLYESGLGMESGYDGIAVAYSKKLQAAPRTYPATFHDAAFYFAYYGDGRKDPNKVREIATWLTQKVDAFVT